MTTPFNYAEMTTRNRGFVGEEEQARLRAGCVFIPGVGGMGGAAFMALVRAGVGRFVIADIDVFEVSNLNRQLFSTLPAIGRPKAEVARETALTINPEAQIELLGAEWTAQLDRLLEASDVAVNGMDDAAAGVHLYRRARALRRTVIDAYASPLPSVTVVAPDAPRPEERLSYPTRGTEWTAITAEMRAECLVKEIEYVLTHSASHKYVDLAVAAEVAAGKRSRFSFSTMVTMAGTLMAEEAIRAILGRPSGTDHRGYFFNPHRARVERPLAAPLAAVRGFAVRRFMRRMMG
ncbi:MAG: ThiF family adenylyltransferase [Alphaproteobacteria bacterium]|nr:ThiF family adenylyltransferase [Alphaproteobacteria bacterium]MBV9370840.1 ThiF family adenylyltransferase [Alphaproteobacteria bacterium]MBV9901271.1 ThiF family adenylyltransferase [Alphaproteobacteria bacterium]